MLKKDKRIFIAYIIFTSLLYITVFGVYYFFTLQFDKVDTDRMINLYQGSMVRSVQNSIDYNKENFEFISSNYEVDYLNSYVQDNHAIRGFIRFIDYDENGFEYLGNSVYLEDNELIEKGFGFFGSYVYYFDTKMVAIIEAAEMFDQSLQQTDANRVFLMNSNGQIYYHRNNESITQVLHEYISSDTTDMIKNEFTNGYDFKINTKIESEEVILSFFNLDKYPNIYVGQSFQIPLIENRLVQYHIGYGLILAILALGNFIILCYIYYRYRVNNLKFGSLLSSSIKSKNYIIIINRNGEINFVNKYFKADFHKINYKNIDEFGFTLENKEKPINCVLEGKSFSVILEEKTIKFMVFETKNSYYLLGDLH